MVFDFKRAIRKLFGIDQTRTTNDTVGSNQHSLDLDAANLVANPGATRRGNQAPPVPVRQTSKQPTDRRHSISPNGLKRVEISNDSSNGAQVTTTRKKNKKLASTPPNRTKPEKGKRKKRATVTFAPASPNEPPHSPAPEPVVAARVPNIGREKIQRAPTTSKDVLNGETVTRTPNPKNTQKTERKVLLSKKSARETYPHGYVKAETSREMAIRSDLPEIFASQTSSKEPVSLSKYAMLNPPPARRKGTTSYGVHTESTISTKATSRLSIDSDDRMIISSVSKIPRSRHDNVLIGSGATANVYKIRTSNGMHRVRKLIKLTQIDVISMEALQHELLVLYALQIAQIKSIAQPSTRHPGLEYLMQIPQDVTPSFARINRLTMELEIVSEYYPLTLDMFQGQIMDAEKSCKDDTIVARVIYFLTSEIAQGLSYLHSQGFVHMDLKPANIFLTAERHCVIGDFGGSVLCSDETGVGIPARMQTFTTAGYRAPEVATYHQPRTTFQRFDHKADFWSLGVCMYAMLVALPDMRAINRKDHNNYQVLGLDATTMINKLDKICYKPEYSKRKAEEYSDMKRLIIGMTTYNARVRTGFEDIVTFLAQRGQYFERRSPSPLLWVQPKNSVSPCIAHPAEPGDYLPAQEVVKELKTYVQLVCGRELVVYPA